MSDCTLAGWYAMWRCPGSPERVDGILRNAESILTNEFPELLDEECVETYVFRVLKEVFRCFDVKKGSQRVAAPQRFMHFFNYQFRRRLARYNQRRRKRLHKWRLRPNLGRRPERARCPVEETFDFWAQYLFDLAVRRLPLKVQRVIEMRCDGRPIADIADKTRLSPKTVSNGYSYKRLAEIVRKEVRTMILEMPSRDVGRVVAHLYGEDLNSEQIGRLLCLPPWIVQKVEGEESNQREALRMLGGDLRKGWAA